ncbi:MAG TPA: hypothetical protein VFZ49_03730 [Pyrinomonadaceae bacterium]
MSNEALAKKIAEILEAERPAADLSGIRASLDAINARLDKLESASQPPQPSFSTTRSQHPSLDKLSIAEAIADQIFAGAGKEKACTFEPNGKPCDHCSMCNSRGF